MRLLLVHHSATPNDYRQDRVAAILQGFYRTHTGPEKGWPDIAYNFLIDRFGRIWEGRADSIDRPIKGDATGGSQGFAQLCCFIGDHTTVAPSPEAQAAMVALLAHLADRYGIDPAPGATVTFTSRGSNRWPPGSQVTATTIAGHRDLSSTACPGDAAYALVQGSFAPKVASLLAADAEVTTTTMAATTSTMSPPVETTTTAATTTTTLGAVPSTTVRSVSGDGVAGGGASAAGGAEGGLRPVVPTAVVVLGAALGGAIALRRRRGR